MSIYKTEQRRVVHRGREFHFVSYQGAPVNLKRGQAEIPATWCLMAAGRRWEVMTQDLELPEADLETRLHAWLEANVFAETARRPRL
jgi:hypothetical protein